MFLHQTPCQENVSGFFFSSPRKQLQHISKNLLQVLLSRSGTTGMELVLLIIADWSITKLAASLRIKAETDPKC